MGGLKSQSGHSQEERNHLPLQMYINHSYLNGLYNSSLNLGFLHTSYNQLIQIKFMIQSGKEQTVEMLEHQDKLHTITLPLVLHMDVKHGLLFRVNNNN